MTSHELAVAAANILDNKKAGNVKVLKTEGVSVLCDYFVIATGNSTTQVRALSDELEFKLKQQGTPPARIEGYDSRNWILLDYLGVIVHIFHPEAREFYKLETLWADATTIDEEQWKEQDA